eukprot:Plantae.Rhodophyta-Hildenbrandia_rubra.ctg21448.p1 GENE.Plantae.Rhodophyta-Hildenbrandia_rubra.ctg21448~~Plantae.Rhodophyta-Hildenbrandia_rubra.ctg21448.p1  ORF type:complete len:302 (+),score=41.68 Plantae.Rhodophyta-Hildenbrandia_rubra.ctg21448:366-1271(+)
MNKSLPPLIPPFRFSIIEEDVFRGAYPTLKNVRFVKRLGLRTIISLLPEAPSDDITEFCAAENIKLYHYYVEKYQHRVALSSELAAAILSIVIGIENHPLYMHCRDGAHNTGTVVMCLRKLQNWNLSMIYHEFVRYTKTREILVEEKEFVESFSMKLDTLSLLPKWLPGVESQDEAEQRSAMEVTSAGLKCLHPLEHQSRRRSRIGPRVKSLPSLTVPRTGRDSIWLQKAADSTEGWLDCKGGLEANPATVNSLKAGNGVKPIFTNISGGYSPYSPSVAALAVHGLDLLSDSQRIANADNL